MCFILPSFVVLNPTLTEALFLYIYPTMKYSDLTDMATNMAFENVAPASIVFFQ
jgi:hypothetical protein